MNPAALTVCRDAFVDEGNQHICQVLVALDTYHTWERSVFRGITQYANEHAGWRLWPWQVPSPKVENGSAPAPGTKVDRPRAYDGALGFFRNEIELSAVREHADFVVNAVGWDAKGAPPFVEIENYAVGVMAADYYLARGFREFAFCRISGDARFARERERGFVERLAANDMAVHLWASHSDAPPLGRWLHQLPKPVALFAENDLTGVQVTTQCVAAGIRVPLEVSVLGVDNDETVCPFGGVPLSSIVVPHDRVGYLAARMLDRAMRTGELETVGERLGPRHIITRGSTGNWAVRDELVLQALKIIRERLHQGVTVDDLAAACAVHRRSLERRFLREVGHSPAQEISRARLERAKELLLTTREAVEVVAERAGYVELRTLMRSIQREHGMTPTEFRRQNKALR